MTLVLVASSTEIKSDEELELIKKSFNINTEELEQIKNLKLKLGNENLTKENEVLDLKKETELFIKECYRIENEEEPTPSDIKQDRFYGTMCDINPGDIELSISALKIQKKILDYHWNKIQIYTILSNTKIMIDYLWIKNRTYEELLDEREDKLGFW